MFFKIRGGENAIKASHRLLAAKRRGDPSIPEISVDQIGEQLSLAVDRVMNEGSLYDPILASTTVKQALGDLTEAAFLVRAARATLERFGVSEPINPAQMTVKRRISTTHKDVPGGQILGPTFDYTHRIVDFTLRNPDSRIDPLDEVSPPQSTEEALAEDLSSLTNNDLIEIDRDADFNDSDHDLEAGDDRSERLSVLGRGDEGFLLGLTYSSLRGFGNTNALAGEIRHGDVVVEILIPELDLVVGIGEISITECQTLHPFEGNEQKAPEFSRGYGLVFGQSERKAISMAIIDRSLRSGEFGEEERFPIQDKEFVLAHADNVNASGFVQVLKLPHYVHFEGRVQMLRNLRAEYLAKRTNAKAKSGEHRSS